MQLQVHGFLLTYFTLIGNSIVYHGLHNAPTVKTTGLNWYICIHKYSRPTVHTTYTRYGHVTAPSHYIPWHPRGRRGPARQRVGSVSIGSDHVGITALTSLFYFSSRLFTFNPLHSFYPLHLGIFHSTLSHRRCRIFTINGLITMDPPLYSRPRDELRDRSQCRGSHLICHFTLILARG
jgi:hypothetical protein